jgi:hypothetical protein
MDKIFHSTFDFFSYAIPGFYIIVSCFILNPQLETVQQFLDYMGKINVATGSFLLIIAYIIGFSIYPIGRFLYKKIGFAIWRRSIQNDIPLFISDKYVLVRQFSDANFKYIETWNMFCALSHNLVVACLITLMLTLIRIVFLSSSNTGFWLLFMFIQLLLTFIFLHRAVIFSLWAAHDLNATISSLNLHKKQ